MLGESVGFDIPVLNGALVAEVPVAHGPVGQRVVPVGGAGARRPAVLGQEHGHHGGEQGPGGVNFAQHSEDIATRGPRARWGELHGVRSVGDRGAYEFVAIASSPAERARPFGKKHFSILPRRRTVGLDEFGLECLRGNRRGP